MQQQFPLPVVLECLFLDRLAIVYLTNTNIFQVKVFKTSLEISVDCWLTVELYLAFSI